MPAQWPSGRVSVVRMVGHGFSPQPGHTRDSKRWYQLPGCLALRVGIGRLPNDHQMIPGCSTAPAQLPTASSGDGLNAEDKIHILKECDNHWDLMKLNKVVNMWFDSSRSSRQGEQVQLS